MKLAMPRWTALLLITLLQACGGGGGSGNNPPPPPPPPPGSNLVALSQSNAETVGILSFGPTDNAFQAMLLLTGAARELHQQSLVMQDFSCTGGGGVQLSALDRNSNNSFNSGDRVTITYTACGASVTGTLVLDITAVGFDSGQIVSLDGTVTIALDFIDTNPATLTGSGNLVHRASASELSWLGTGFSVTLAIGSQREILTNGRVEKIVTAPGLRYSVTLSGTIDSDFLDGRFTFTTNPAFAGDEGQWPESGRLTATGRSNSQLSYRTLSTVQGLAGYEVDADGNGVIDNPVAPVDWIDIANGVVFGAPGDNDIPPPPNPGPDVLGRRIALGAPGEDLLVDNARGVIYVTVPNRHELLIFSAQSLEIVRRVYLASRPNGMSLSADGNEIFVGLGASGSIAVVDANIFAISTIFVATELESSRVFDVVETAPGVLYAGAGIPLANGRIARVERSSGVITPLGTASPNFGEIELLADAAHGVLYAGDGLGTQAPALYKYDAANSQTPVLLQKLQSAGDVTHRLSLDPTGARLYLSSGQVLNTSDFSQIGRITRGTPWASDNGVDVMVGTGEGVLHIHSAADLREMDTIQSDCALHQEVGDLVVDVDRLAPSPVDGQWLLMGGDILCAIDLNNPTVPPGTGQPGVQPNPLPVVNVQTAHVIVPGTIVDAEFDDFRNRVYVSVPSAGEVMTIDPTTPQIIEHDVLGNRPYGLDLSPDGSTLSIMFNGNGNIGYKDLASGLTITTDLTSFLGTTFGNDVAYLSDDAIFASADAPCCETDAYLVKTSRTNPAATRRSASGALHRFRVELTASPDGNFLYMREGPNQLFKLDLNSPDEPAVRTYEKDTSGFSFVDLGRPNVSPDSARIAFSDGEVLRTGDLFQAGQAGTQGAVLYSPDGASLYQMLGSSFLDRYDPATFQPTLRYQGNCSSSPNRLLTNAAGNRVVSVGQIEVCVWMLDQPVASAIKVGPHSPYVCGVACAVRQYQKRAGSSLWRWRNALLP